MVCDPPLILLSQTLSLHPDLSIALPIQALLLIPQFLQPQSRADVSTKASSWRQTERQVSHIWKVPRILKRVISSIQSEFVALKVWLTKCSYVHHHLKPKTNGHCGEETCQRQIFCSVWRKTSESTPWNSYWCRGYKTRMVSSVLDEDWFLLCLLA